MKEYLKTHFFSYNKATTLLSASAKCTFCTNSDQQGVIAANKKQHRHRNPQVS